MGAYNSLHLPFNMQALLDAISEVESSSGVNDYPRFEPAYAPPGKSFTVQGRIVQGTGRAFSRVAEERWNVYGMASACSYSQWQILYHTAADLGYRGHPVLLWAMPETARFYVERFIERQVLRGAVSIEQIADAYNSGNFKDAYVPHAYVERLATAYKKRVKVDA